MGLIKAAKNAIGGTLRDQYKEYIECPSFADTDLLVVRGRKSIFEGGTNRGDDNVITDGSVIAVADGQCMIIVEDGKIIDFCVGDSQAQTTGRYIYKTGTAPSLLTGGFKGLKDSFNTIWGRIQSGGQIDRVQRVYYINMLEVMDNKFGIGDLPFRDSEFGFTVNLKCYGTYSYKITDPIIFYSKVCGNVAKEYRRNAKLEGELKSNVHSKLSRALAKVALKGIAYDQLNIFSDEVTAAVNAELEEEWVKGRGISIGAFSIEIVDVDEESKKQIKEFQTSRYYANPLAAAGLNAKADADAKRAAAQNAAGPHVGFMNLNFAQQASANTHSLFSYGQQQMQVPQYGFNQQAGFTPQFGFTQPQVPNQANPAMDANVEPQAEENIPQEQPAFETPTTDTASSPVVPAANASDDGWKCEQCGTENRGKFCIECGNQAPAPVQNTNGWKCVKCGTENTGKFCMECGSPKPLDSKCETCGYEGTQPFKFCPECGAENKI